MRPYYHITLGNVPLKRESANAESLLLDLRVDMAMFKANIARIRLLAQTGPEIKRGDEVVVKLGDRETNQVFKGEVSEITFGIRHIDVLAISRLALLANNRVNKLFEQTKAGDIINDFSAEVGLDTSQIDAGTTYASYTADAKKNQLEHSIQLARREGFDLYTDEKDALYFAKPKVGEIHLLRYGAEILDAQKLDDIPEVEGVEVYGESPASLGQGDDAYSWLTKSEVKGNAGSSSGNVRRIVDPAIRDVSSAGLAAENIYARLSQTQKGKLSILGNPNIYLGDTINVSGFPQSNYNGSFKVVRLIHRLNKKHGFTTEIFWEETQSIF